MMAATSSCRLLDLPQDVLCDIIALVGLSSALRGVSLTCRRLSGLLASALVDFRHEGDTDWLWPHCTRSIPELELSKRGCDKHLEKLVFQYRVPITPNSVSALALQGRFTEALLLVNAGVDAARSGKVLESVPPVSAAMLLSKWHQVHIQGITEYELNAGFVGMTEAARLLLARSAGGLLDEMGDGENLEVGRGMPRSFDDNEGNGVQEWVLLQLAQGRADLDQYALPKLIQDAPAVIVAIKALGGAAVRDHRLTRNFSLLDEWQASGIATQLSLPATLEMLRYYLGAAGDLPSHLIAKVRDILINTTAVQSLLRARRDRDVVRVGYSVFEICRKILYLCLHIGRLERHASLLRLATLDDSLFPAVLYAARSACRATRKDLLPLKDNILMTYLLDSVGKMISNPANKSTSQTLILKQIVRECRTFKMLMALTRRFVRHGTPTPAFLDDAVLKLARESPRRLLRFVVLLESEDLLIPLNIQMALKGLGFDLDERLDNAMITSPTINFV